MGRIRPQVRSRFGRHYRRPGGAWDVPTLDTLLTDASHHARLVVAGEQHLTSPEVNEEIARMAGGLRERGVRRGDTVAWQIENGVEAALLFRACWRLGAVAVPIHHRAGYAEVAHITGQVSPAVVLAPGDGEGLLKGQAVLDPAARPSDLACVLFTSGSTGKPKGVLHTHRGLASKTTLMRGVHGLTPDDSVLMPAPLAHISGLLNGVLVPGAVPMKGVLMSRWDPEAALRLVEEERITFMVGPPTFFVQMAGAPSFSRERVETLRLISSGGAGVTPAFVEEATRVFGAVVKRTYGSTEAPTIATAHAGDEAALARDTDGRVVGPVELRVVDPATGDAVPPGEVGELWVRGPEVCAGYVDRAHTRAAFARGGWFRTGDLASLDSVGWLTVAGRLDDVVIRGGENISATEVAGELEAHPSVDQAVVLGVPDDEMGERVAAVVVAAEDFDLEVCRTWFESRGVTKFKTPERVLRVDSIPTLASGKPDLAALRGLLTG